MSYGGSRRAAGGCLVAIDGMPAPDDPDWKLEADGNGCPKWTNPNDHFVLGGTDNPATKYCGAGPPELDAGPDADASSDAEAGP